MTTGDRTGLVKGKTSVLYFFNKIGDDGVKNFIFEATDIPSLCAFLVFSVDACTHRDVLSFCSVMRYSLLYPSFLN